jgi:hypothetical protein
METLTQEILSKTQASMTDTRNREQALRASVSKQILKTLYFPTVSDRQEAVPEAYGQTFGWIFQPSSTEEDENSYIEWLTSRSGIHWVNSKAGSGKSTLMRYLYRHSRTVEHLKNWSASNSLCVAAFFFWNSGTLEQRSQSGLLRSLLYQVHLHHQELIPVVLPVNWAKGYISLIDSVKPEQELWSLSRLKQAFHLLVRQDIVKIKLCLFIDGIDEYEGDHDEIAQLFEYITSSPHVKVCLSSRPLVLFEDALGSFPKIQLQDLTLGDIRQYVTDNLGSHRHFWKLTLVSPQRTSDLINGIVKKTEGVFLWQTGCQITSFRVRVIVRASEIFKRG